MSRVTWTDLQPILRRSAKVALVVGPILTLINQWEAVTALQMPHIGKSLLTFLVPFCVSFFSGYTMRKNLAAQICATNRLIDNLRAAAKTAEDRAEVAEKALLNARAPSKAYMAEGV